MRIEYHRTLIDDRVRVAAFHEALKRAIRPGESVVADIGAGTGLIGAMAAKLGAKRVYLYEAAEVAGVAEEVLKRNRIRNAEIFASHSTEFDDPPKADIVVSETLGNYALEEDIIETMADAAKRHLKPGGVLIPSRILQFVAPVVSPRIDTQLRAWDRATSGLTEIDLSPAKALTLNNIYVRTIAPEELLPRPQAARKTPPFGEAEGRQGGSAAASPILREDLRESRASIDQPDSRRRSPPTPPRPSGKVGSPSASGTEIAAVEWDRIDLGRDSRSSRKGEASWTLAADTTVYGFALWWTAELLPGLILSTAPDAPATHWEQLYLPLAEPIAAARGDIFGLSIKSRTTRESGTTIAWSALHRSASGEAISRQNMDLEKGYLP